MELSMEERKSVVIGVKVIHKMGKSTLVEYSSEKGLLRVVIPSSIIKDGKAALEDLEAGIPYGVRWEDIKVKPFDPHQLAMEFRNEGIFSLDDLYQKRIPALACIQRVLGLTLSEIINQFKE